MKIGFDVSQTGTGKAGCGWFADSLIRALAEIDERRDYVLYPTFGDDYQDPEGPHATRRLDRPNFSVGPACSSLAEARELWHRPPGELDHALGKPDIVHSHNFFCPRGLRDAKLIYTLYDLAFLSHPEWTTERNRQLCFDGVFEASLRADFVMAISEHSRRHFLDVFPHYPADRTGVVYPASRFDVVTKEVSRPVSLSQLQSDGFLLFVGTLEPRKNPLRMVRAYARYVAAACEPLPLALAGGEGWLMGDFDRLVDDLGLTRHVLRLGYVDDDELGWLYRHCRAFVYPSLFEGFGLPVVEAMSQGAAVVTSSTSSIPEVANGAAVLVDPTDEDELLRAITRVAHDPNDLRAQAPAAATKFSWPRAAEEVLAIYDLVAAMDKYEGLKTPHPLAPSPTRSLPPGEGELMLSERESSGL